jgi:hypothetical protein
VIALAVLNAGMAQEPDAYLGRPEPEHAVLKEDIGRWKAEMKVWMAPDAPPEMTTGTETNRLLGGLWLISDFRAEFAGEPYQGHGINGYDPVKKKYVGTWVDSMSKTMISMEGDYDAATKTMTMLGKSYDPAQQKLIDTKIGTSTKDENTRTMAMYMLPAGPGGEEIKAMEVTYTLETRTPARKGAPREKDAGKDADG